MKTTKEEAEHLIITEQTNIAVESFYKALEEFLQPIENIINK